MHCNVSILSVEQSGSFLMGCIPITPHKFKHLYHPLYLRPRAADNGCFSSQQPACNCIKSFFESLAEVLPNIGRVTPKHLKRWAMSIWSKRGWVVNIPNRSPVRHWSRTAEGWQLPTKPGLFLCAALHPPNKLKYIRSFQMYECSQCNCECSIERPSMRVENSLIQCKMRSLPELMSPTALLMPAAQMRGIHYVLLHWAELSSILVKVL